MKRTPILLAFAAFLVFAIVACQKTYNKDNISTPAPDPTAGTGPTTYPNTTVSLNELFKDLRTTPEKQCVTAGVAQTITFAKGTRLTFYPNSFKDAAGNILTSGEVCLEMVEMYKPGDMIANRATTVTKDGEILMSGGQVHIKATMDGKEVFANRYGIAFPQPAPSTQPMNLYYGDRNNKDSLVEWTLEQPGTGTFANTTVSIDSFVTAAYIFDSCTTFTFINCDVLPNPTSSRTNVTVTMPDTLYNGKNSMVFVIMTEQNMVVSARQYNADKTSFGVAQDKDHQVPIGLAASVCVISIRDDKYFYFEKKEITVTDGLTVNAEMKEVPEHELTTKLSAL